MEHSASALQSDDEAEAKNVLNQVLFTLALVISSIALFWLHDRQSHIVQPPMPLESAAGGSAQTLPSDGRLLSTQDILLLNRD
jgi:hypothetical protein